MLVTLRKGALEGLLILLWAALPDIAKFYQGDHFSLLVDILAGGVSGWLLAIVLRKKNQWVTLLYLSAVLGVAGVLIVHVIMPNPDAWWMQQLSQELSQSQVLLSGTLDSANAGQMQNEVHSVLKYALQFATGIQAAFILISVFAELIIARNIQLLLEKQVRLPQELRSIRLHPLAVLILLMMTLLAIWGPAIFRDLSPVIALPFFLASISLIHGLAAIKQLSLIWLVGFYVVLIVAIAFFPALLLSLILFSVIDSFINFRAFVARSKKRGV
jgi:hypothetical protein